jgi:hypothetical protein
MSLGTILLIVLLVLLLTSAGGYGYGRWYAGPLGAGPAPYANPLGILAALLIILLIIGLFTGWWFPHPVVVAP